MDLACKRIILNALVLKTARTERTWIAGVRGVVVYTRNIMGRRMKSLIKWLYFEHVYPDEVEAIYKILDQGPIVTFVPLEEIAVEQHTRLPKTKLH